MKNLFITLTLTLFTFSSFTKSTHNLHFNDSKTMLLEGTELTWFTLPYQHGYHVIKLAISIQDRKLFYPVVTLYDVNKKVRSVIRSPIQIVPLGAYKEGIDINIPISPDDSYMSINMP